MSYRLDLDEQTTESLAEELRRRGDAAQQGLCDYCGRPPVTPSCKLSDRHASPYDADAKAVLHDIGDRKGWDASRRMDEPCDFINAHGLGDVFQAWLARRPR